MPLRRRPGRRRGWQALRAAQRFDVPVIMGSVLFGALAIGPANLAVDLLYTRGLTGADACYGSTTGRPDGLGLKGDG
jgi:hypothetical protein